MEDEEVAVFFGSEAPFAEAFGIVDAQQPFAEPGVDVFAAFPVVVVGGIYLCGRDLIFGVVEAVDVFNRGVFEFRGVGGPIARGGDEEEGPGGHY